MKTKVLPTLLLATLSLGMTGCFSGRTSVVASHYASKPYDIYLNGYFVCKMGGDYDCSFQTRGTTAGGILEAYLDDQRVGSIEVHRSMSFLSLLWAIPTYTLSLWLYQAYPDEIEIPIDTYVKRPSNSSETSETSVSVWDRPYTLPQKTKKTVKPVETAPEPVETEEPKAVRGENAAPVETEEPASGKSVWD
jgi:hypothetical protein